MAELSNNNKLSPKKFNPRKKGNHSNRNTSVSDLNVKRKPEYFLNRSLSTNNATPTTARTTKIAALRRQASIKQSNILKNEILNENHSEPQNDSSYKTLFQHKTEIYEGEAKIPVENKQNARVNWMPQRPTIIREWESNVVRRSPKIVDKNSAQSSKAKSFNDRKSLVCEISQDVDIVGDSFDDDSDSEEESPMVLSLISSGSEEVHLSPVRQRLHKEKPDFKNKGSKGDVPILPDPIWQLSGVNDIFKANRSNYKASVLLEQLRLAVTKYNDLKKEFDSLIIKYENTKSKNEALQIECSEAHYYIQRNHHLEKHVVELTNALLQKDASFSKKESELSAYEKNTDFMQEKVIKLNGEIEKLKEQLTEQDKILEISESLKQADLLKDHEIKFLHNELIDMKGKIRVIARFKPEVNDVFEFFSDDTIRINPSILTVEGKAKHIIFNRVFHPQSTQEDIFEDINPYIKSAVDGYNVCVMTFGQTGSGKTYTMYGTKNCPGIISRVLPYILDITNKRNMWNYKFNLSIIQIYNETIMDLLSDKISFLTLTDNGNSVVVKDLTERTITNESEMIEFINLGRRRRSTARTIFNTESSRSHFIVSFRIFGESMGNMHTEGVLNLCDLAGFERTGELPINSLEVNESKFIGKSLSGLGRVLNALQLKEKCIPYRDCKLTHFLKPSLSGDAKCVLILTVSTRSDNINATMRTLDMGQQALSIRFNQGRKQVTTSQAKRENVEDKRRRHKEQGNIFSKVFYPRSKSQCVEKQNVLSIRS